MSYDTIAGLGAGAWGSALANCAARGGRSVRWWGRDAEAIALLRQRRESPRLPGIKLADNVTVTSALDEAVSRAEAALLVVPAQAARSVATRLAATGGTKIP